MLRFPYGTTLTSIHDVMNQGKSSTGKAIALTEWTFVGKVMSLLFNMLSRLVITFLPKNKCLFMAAVTICSDFGAPKNEVCHCFPIYLP